MFKSQYDKLISSLYKDRKKLVDAIEQEKQQITYLKDEVSNKELLIDKYTADLDRIIKMLDKLEVE